MPRQKLHRVHQYEFAEHANSANTVNHTSETPVAGHATLAGHANTTGFTETVLVANNAGFANTANVANTAGHVTHATHVSFVEHATAATTANTANNATHANTADNANTANNTTWFDGHALSEFLRSTMQTQQHSMLLNQAQLNVLYATPLEFLAAPLANQVHLILSISFVGIGWSFGTIKDIGLQYGNTGNAGGVLIPQGGVTFGGNVDPTPQNTFYAMRSYSLTGNSNTMMGKSVCVVNAVSLDGGVRNGSQVKVWAEYITVNL